MQPAVDLPVLWSSYAWSSYQLIAGGERAETSRGWNKVMSQRDAGFALFALRVKNQMSMGKYIISKRENCRVPWSVRPEDLAYFEEMLQECNPKKMTLELSFEG